ncbi:MAG: efflux RND transporter periplasmic adaptor subunit [Cardiobacteriaceae bacterium]|nr:efflux RND transporter periplasmic adaptor subunit [Cardiobacteriaceae bacterium]
MRKALIILILVALTGGLAYLAIRERPIFVTTARAQTTTLQQTFSEEGKTRVKARYQIAAPVAGTLRRITLQPGDSVAAGQTVAEIEPATAALLDARSRERGEAELRAAEAAQQAAEERIHAAQSAQTLARKEQHRLQSLVKAKAASRQQLDHAQAQLENADAQLAAARAEVQMAKARVEAAQAQLNTQPGRQKTVIHVKAPAAGLLLRRHLESETPVSPGQPLMETGDPGELELEADILSDDAVRLAPGTPARVLHWGGEALAATVSRIEPGGFTKVSALGVEEQRTRVLLDLASPREQWQTLGDAYRVDIEFITASKENALAIPASALFRDANGWAVWRIEEGRARRTPVETGLRAATQVEITSGLAEGDSVILQPDDMLRDGSLISETP